MKIYKRLAKGFSLMEMLLVLVIMSSMLLLITNYGTHRMDQFRRDKTALQMQQILNAAMAYYVSNGQWPVTTCDGGANTLNTLITANYLPPNMSKNMYGNAYSISCAAATNVFTVSSSTKKAADATIIAGMLPAGVASALVVTGQVNVPGQNLNNARSVNFAGLYHTGACVPVPSCPAGMTAQIFAVPASVSGVNDAPTPSGCSAPVNGVGGTCTAISSYPITSFSAYATGPSAAAVNNGPPNCDGSSNPECYADLTNGVGGATVFISNPGQKFWRVCLNIMTEKGVVKIPSGKSYNNPQNMFWAQSMGVIMVTTRCAPNAGENLPDVSGSSFNVWGPTK